MQLRQGLGTGLELQLDANYVRRLTSATEPVSGSLIGLGAIGAFNQNLEASKDWYEVRAGIDVTPSFLADNVHLRLGYQINFGQQFDVPTYRIDSGLVVYF